MSESIAAEIPYLRSELQSVQVEFEDRILDERTVEHQTWRVLTDPPQDFPLAICDWRTVTAADIVPLEYHVGTDGSDVTYRSQGSRYSDRHEWWYFPELTVDELVLFVGFDSARADSPASLHVSFEDPTVQDPVPRASIESRFFGLFD